MAITRTPWTDDDGSGTTGTIINNAWLTSLYDAIDAALLTAGAPTRTAWTPSFASNGGNSGQTYAARSGWYFKQGSLVMISGRIALSAKGTFNGSIMQISGLPFPVAAIFDGGSVTVPHFEAMASGITTLIGYPVNGSSLVEMRMLAAPAANIDFVSPGLITNTTEIRFAGFYFA